MSDSRSYTKLQYWWITLLGAAFIAYCGYFIYNSSFIAIDGNRYFSLGDDALISMRYAWNLAHGHGLVYNIGERIEGITNLLMTLLMAVFAWILNKRQAVLCVQLSGVLFLIINALMMYRITVALLPKNDKLHAALVMLAYATPLICFPLIYWSLFGLETGLLSMLISVAMYCWIKKGKADWAVPFLLGLAYWTRPDSAIVISLIIFFRAIDFAKDKNFQKIIYDCSVVGALVVAVTAFRLTYYGCIFPNTYTLKLTGVDLGTRIHNGIGYIWPFIQSLPVLFILCVPAVLLKRNKYFVLFVAMLLAAICYQIYVGGDAFGLFRQMAPFLPYFYLMAFIGLAEILEYVVPKRLASTRIFPTSIFPAFLALCLALVLFSQRGFVSRSSLFKCLQSDNVANVNTAIFLNGTLKPTASLAVFYAGSIPYYTGFKSYDMLGKCDKYIASLPPDLSGKIAWLGMNSVPGHNKYDLNYSIISNRPTYVQGFAWGGQNVKDYVRAHYAFVSVAFSTIFTDKDVLLLKDSPDVRWEILVSNMTIPTTKTDS